MTPSLWRHAAPHELVFTFDLEGTLVDLELLHFLAFERAMGSIGVALTSDEISAIPGAIGGGDPYIAEALGRRTNSTPQVILRHKEKHFEALLREHPMMPRAGAVALIKRLQHLQFSLAIGSLTPRSRGEVIMRRSGLDALFESGHVLFREDVERPKPDPEVYLKTAERLGFEPARQVVFEDSPVGVRAARAAGSRAIGMPSPMFQASTHIYALGEAGAESVFESWSDVHPLFYPALVASSGGA